MKRDGKIYERISAQRERIGNQTERNEDGGIRENEEISSKQREKKMKLKNNQRQLNRHDKTY